MNITLKDISVKGIKRITSESGILECLREPDAEAQL